MKTFYASYYESWGYGNYEEHDYVVTAETESAALGWVLQYCPSTHAKGWNLEEIDTTTAGVFIPD